MAGLKTRLYNRLYGSEYATSSPGLIELLLATTMYCLPLSK
jgi:hypothetical protein